MVCQKTGAQIVSKFVQMLASSCHLLWQHNYDKETREDVFSQSEV